MNMGTIFSRSFVLSFILSVPIHIFNVNAQPNSTISTSGIGNNSDSGRGKVSSNSAGPGGDSNPAGKDDGGGKAGATDGRVPSIIPDNDNDFLAIEEKLDKIIANIEKDCEPCATCDCDEANNLLDTVIFVSEMVGDFIRALNSMKDLELVHLEAQSKEHQATQDRIEALRTLLEWQNLVLDISTTLGHILNIRGGLNAIKDAGGLAAALESGKAALFGFSKSIGSLAGKANDIPWYKFPDARNLGSATSAEIINTSASVASKYASLVNLSDKYTAFLAKDPNLKIAKSRLAREARAGLIGILKTAAEMWLKAEIGSRIARLKELIKDSVAEEEAIDISFKRLERVLARIAAARKLRNLADKAQNKIVFCAGTDLKCAMVRKRHRASINFDGGSVGAFNRRCGRKARAAAQLQGDARKKAMEEFDKFCGKEAAERVSPGLALKKLNSEALTYPPQLEPFVIDKEKCEKKEIPEPETLTCPECAPEHAKYVEAHIIYWNLKLNSIDKNGNSHFGAVLEQMTVKAKNDLDIVKGKWLNCEWIKCPKPKAVKPPYPLTCPPCAEPEYRKYVDAHYEYWELKAALGYETGVGAMPQQLHEAYTEYIKTGVTWKQCERRKCPAELPSIGFEPTGSIGGGGLIAVNPDDRLADIGNPLTVESLVDPNSSSNHACAELFKGEANCNPNGCALAVTNVSFQNGELRLDPFGANGSVDFPASGTATNTNLNILGQVGHTCKIKCSAPSEYTITCTRTNNSCSSTCRRN